MTETYTAFDPSAYLDSEEAVRGFLADALESADAKVIAAALGEIARSRGMTQIAKDADVSRESLYRALSEDGNPRLDTVLRVVKALGYGLTITRQPADAAE